MVVDGEFEYESDGYLRETFDGRALANVGCTLQD